MNSIVTEHKGICIICGRQAECEHHLVFGSAGRELSEKDGLKIPLCNNCHNMGEKLRRIHDNPMAERLSKIIGQLAWERDYLLADATGVCGEEEEKAMSELVRNQFRKRFGISYL